MVSDWPDFFLKEFPATNFTDYTDFLTHSVKIRGYELESP
jgi:hypothetical protein